MTTEDVKVQEPSKADANEDGQINNEDAKHPLEHKWTLWYDPGNSARTPGQWGNTLRSVYSFDTVEDFWCLYNNIKAPTALSAGSDFHLFKKTIEPKWEDPRNAGGGKWTVTLKKGLGTLDGYWLNVLMACIGEHFTEGDDVCGAVVQIRGRQDRISIWTRSANDEAVQVSIGKQLRGILDLDNSVRVSFTTHEDAKQEKTPKDKYTL